MARKTLHSEISDEYDFLLIGIVCQHKDYRLCHFLNRQLSIRLTRDTDYEITKPRNKQKLSFAFYTYARPEQACYYLFANKTEGGILISDHKNMDYFLMIKEYQNRLDEEWLIAAIKNSPLVLGAYSVQPGLLRSKENLVF